MNTAEKAFAFIDDSADRFGEAVGA